MGWKLDLPRQVRLNGTYDLLGTCVCCQPEKVRFSRFSSRCIKTSIALAASRGDLIIYRERNYLTWKTSLSVRENR